MAGHRGPKRARPTLTEAEVRRLIRILIALVGVVDIVMGGGYLFGAPASAPSLQMLDAAGGLKTWALALAVAGVCLFFRPARIVGFVAGGFVWVVWSFFSVAVLFNHTATGWGWPPYLALAAVNVIGTWSESKAATRRR